jgi:hypothetical protein
VRENHLEIAGYKIEIEPPAGQGKVNLHEKFDNFRGLGSDVSDLLLRVHYESFTPPPGTEKVFEAPFVREEDGRLVTVSKEFWSVYRNKTDIFLSAVPEYTERKRTAWLKLSLTSRNWDIYTGSDDTGTDPLAYPLDGLLLYYLTVTHGDIFIHASAVNNFGKGYIFSGVSGKGKSTISSIWEQAGAEVIHDDRIIIRHGDGKYWLHNTPVYNNETPRKVALTRVFLLNHGHENDIFPLTGAPAVSQVLANCIQHNWSPELIARLMGSLSLMCSSVPCFRLDFKPDRSVVDFLLDYE